MNYELAKKLKDAGFSNHKCLEKDLYEGCDGDPYCVFRVNNKLDRYEFVCAPTLSELIEACGDKLRYMQRMENCSEWVAGTYDSYESGEGLPDSNVWRGETLEIAVANLWLALNKK